MIYMFYRITAIILTSFLMGCVLSGNTLSEENQKIAAQDNVELGLAYLQQKNMTLSKEKLLRALQEAPQWPVAEDAMGYFLETTGDKIQAEKYYQQAILKNSIKNNGAAFNNYGGFLCRSHEPEKAEKMFLKAVNDPDYLNTAKAYQNAGLCALTQADKFKAKYYFMKALEHDPALTIARSELQKRETG